MCLGVRVLGLGLGLGVWGFGVHRDAEALQWSSPSSTAYEIKYRHPT